MISRFGLRARLTLLVTSVFAVTMSIMSIVVIDAVEDDLVDGTRTNAEAVLSSYLASIYGGTATVGVVDATESTRFFYRDDDGNEISEQQYFDTITAGLELELGGLFGEQDDPFVAAGGTGADEVLEPIDHTVFDGIEIDPDTGELLDSSGSVVSFIAEPRAIGDPHPVDVGDGLVAVAQTLSFNDGATVEVGVSSPVKPVTDSLDAIRQIIWIAVLALVAAIAAITWLAANRALRSVHAISSQASAITGAKINRRLPVPEADDEIRELAITVNAMLARLEASQKRQHQLVADASHELRSPVAASRAQLEVATADPETTDWRATAATVLAEQEHLSHLIDDLLALSRIDEAGYAAATDVDLDDLIAIEAERPHPAPVRTSVPTPVRVTGDQKLLARALRNLVDNATRHARSEVHITLSRHEGNAGPGIPDDQRERIFDRFTRIDEARDRNHGGAGLGLAIASEVANAHSGCLTATQSPLGGARFTLAIPYPQR